MPDPVAQLQAEREPQEEKPPASWQQRVGQGALVIGGVVVASCLLVVKVRKLCASIVMTKQAKHLPQQMDEVALASDAPLLRYEEKIAQLQDEIATLQREGEELRNFVNTNTGRQVTLNGSFFEHHTEHALYKIIPNLYEGERVEKIFRNIDGHFSDLHSRNKNFEIDAIVITTERVFAIETKVTLSRENVDRFVALLKKFPQLKFANKKIYEAVQSKPVHGGFSYQFDTKLKLDVAHATRTASARQGNEYKQRQAVSKVRSASGYARKHGLLTIPRLTDHKSRPQQLDKLSDFQSQ